jgi:hypothetical protein
MVNWNSKRFWPVVLSLTAITGVVLLAFGQERQGDWELQTQSFSDRLQLRLRSFDGNGSHGFGVSASELRNLPGGVLSGDGPANFEVVRDAGRLVCQGTFRNGRGSGNFQFISNPEYFRELSRLGYNEPRENERFTMFVMNVTLDFARAIRDAGLKASSSNLVEMRIHGVTADYIRQARAEGYTNLSTRDFVEMRIHGVTTDFLRDLKNAGYDLSSREVAQLRIHGVTSDYMKALQTYGLRPAASDLTELRIHGVTPEYLRDLKNAGYGNLSAKEITELRIHGVSPGFAEEARRLGFNFTTKELTELRIHGVDGAYLKRLQDAGFRNLSASQIARLRIHGVD